MAIRRFLLGLVGTLVAITTVRAELRLAVDARNPGGSPSTQWQDLSGLNQPLLAANATGSNPVYNVKDVMNPNDDVYEFGRVAQIHWFATQGADENRFDFPANLSGQGANPAGAVTVVAYMDNQTFVDNTAFWSKGSGVGPHHEISVFRQGGFNDVAQMDVGSTNGTGFRAMSQANPAAGPSGLQLWVFHFDGSGNAANFQTYLDGSTTNIGAGLAGQTNMVNGSGYFGSADPLHLGSKLGITNPDNRFFGDIQFIEVYAGSTITNSLVTNMSPADYSQFRFANLTQIISPGVSTTFEWDEVGGGNWHLADNWNPAQIPNGADITAVLGDRITADSTIATDSNVTLNSLQFDNANRYAVAGAGVVSMSTSGALVTPTFSVAQGSHQMQAVTHLLNNTAVSVSSGAQLSFENEIRLNGNTLTKSGTGTLLIDSDVHTGGGTVDVTAGTVGGNGTIGGNLTNTSGNVAPGNSPGLLAVNGNFTQAASGTLTIEVGGANASRVAGTDYDQLKVTGTATLGGTLAVQSLPGLVDLGSSTAIANANRGKAATFTIVDTDSGISGSFATRTYNGGALNAENGKGIFKSTTVTGNDLLFTILNAKVGDADGDRIVSATDVFTAVNNLGAAVVGSDWTRGNFDLDGIISATDVFNAVNALGAYTPAATSGAISSVPEPASLGWIMAAVGLLGIRSGHRRWS